MNRDGAENLPPWLWVWLAVYAITFPGVVRTWQQSFSTLLGEQDVSAEILGGLPVLTQTATRLASVAEVVPSFALTLGILTIFIPWTRRRYLERRFRLSEQPVVSPALGEIEIFLEKHAPGIEIRPNLLRTDQLAFVYPLGYRKTAIAVFGGLIKLWRSDRDVAEAVLLHETAHYRQGDTLIVGAGSFFEAVVKNLLLLYVLFLFVPQLLAIVGQRIVFIQESLVLGVPASSLVVLTLTQLTVGLVLLLFQSVTLLFWTMSIFILPLLGIWWAEFNADRFVATSQGSAVPLSAALEKLPRTSSWWKWLLSRLSHPPAKARRWMVSRSVHMTGVIILLLFFPLGYLAKLGVLSAWAMTSYLGTGFQFSEIVSGMISNVSIAWSQIQVIWLAMALLIAIWPIAARKWESLFCKVCGEAADAKRPQYGAYLFSATLLGSMPALGFIL